MVGTWEGRQGEAARATQGIRDPVKNVRGEKGKELCPSRVYGVDGVRSEWKGVKRGLSLGSALPYPVNLDRET